MSLSLSTPIDLPKFCDIIEIQLLENMGEKNENYYF